MSVSAVAGQANGAAAAREPQAQDVRMDEQVKLHALEDAELVDGELNI